MISQFYVLLLTLIAARVAYGLYKQKIMWAWIVLYWMTLTCKNVSDLIDMCLMR